MRLQTVKGPLQVHSVAANILIISELIKVSPLKTRGDTLRNLLIFSQLAATGLPRHRASPGATGRHRPLPSRRAASRHPTSPSPSAGIRGRVPCIPQGIWHMNSHGLRRGQPTFPYSRSSWHYSSARDVRTARSRRHHHG